jgi:hypothetical protein
MLDPYRRRQQMAPEQRGGARIRWRQLQLKHAVPPLKLP